MSLLPFLASPQLTPWLNLITLIALCLTCVGVVLALRSLADGKEMLATNREVSNTLREVSNSLTTHRVGEFRLGESPGYIDEVARLVESAMVSIDIMAILPGIGYFGFPNKWVGLSSALQTRQANGVKVSLLVGSRDSRRVDHRVRFAEARKDWNQFITSPKTASLLEQFIRRYHYSAAGFATPQDFEDFCLDVDEKIISEVFAMAEVQTTNSFMPVTSWIVDGNMAFFAITHSEGRTTGFITRDQNLIKSLLDLRPRYL